jgi:superfamily II DNA/RNA helicase
MEDGAIVGGKESLRWENLVAINKIGKEKEKGKPLLSASTLQTLKDLKFDQMTPVQAATIPLFLANKDVAVEVMTCCDLNSHI